MAEYQMLQRRLARLEGKSSSTPQRHGPARVIVVRYTEDWREVEQVNPALEARIEAEVAALTPLITTEATLAGYEQPYHLTLYVCDTGEMTPEAPPWAPHFPPNESSRILLQLALHNQELTPDWRLLVQHTIGIIEWERSFTPDGKLPRWPAHRREDQAAHA